MTVVFASAANRDLEQIVDFLNETGEWASLFLNDLDDAVAHLNQWPDAGARREEIHPDPRLRFWLIEPYQMVYLRESGRLHVLAVMHSARDLHRELQSRLGG